MDNLKKSLLYSSTCDLIDLLIQWLASLTSSSTRPFRHTSTLASITILTSLTKTMNIIDTEHTKLDQRLQVKPNQKLSKTVQDLKDKKQRLDALINDLFDGVFVHRYRDSDPQIRADCIQSFGNWIVSFPDLFLEPQYLKYLGWMLSDKVYYY